MFLDIIRDIENALEKEVYLSALALSLTLPDICGKVEFPTIKSTKQRYIKWYDKHITNNNYPDEHDEALKFNGEKCYELRCSYLHAGEVEQLVGIQDFQLIIINKTHPIVYGGSCDTTYIDQNENKTYTIQQDVAQLCYWIYKCAEVFYKQHENKEVFDKINPIVKVKY
ncbi:MAG: hypothetical protein R3Y09_11390 [Clostridia bacterium]